MTVNEFEKIVLDWIATARDPRFKRPYTELALSAMIELQGFLRASGFKTFIVSAAVSNSCAHGRSASMVFRQNSVGSSIKTSSRCAMAGRVVPHG